ncbi:MAG: cell wall metabolism sensor histidine kinase WalK [Methylacidiphilales bacterium]|nr:cell wall metabolism sensor histidine kinase WalK [Candidatus Methylacidiphilales bacterium]MDW8349109.1 ATP-binding protein [Verrucomicrobiae bacterium]
MSLWELVLIFVFCICVAVTIWLYARVRSMVRVGKALDELSRGIRHKKYFFGNSKASRRWAGFIEGLAARLEQLEDQVQKEAYDLKALLENMAEGVAIVDENHVIQEANLAVGRLFGIKEVLIGRSVLEVFRNADLEIILRKAIDSGKRQQCEISVTTDQSQERVVEASVTPIIHPSTREAHARRGAILLFHDITEFKRVENVRREFVTNVSHELRTPLSVFRGYLEILLAQRRVDISELHRILSIMNKHVSRLTSLVDELVDLARLETGRVGLEPLVIKVPELLERIVNDWRLILKESQQEIELICPRELPLLEADPARMEQVMHNLLENASKYSEPHTRITVRAEHRDHVIRITVSDQGMGIPAQDLPYIFDRFYRVDKSRSRDRGGMGLGLSIVKQIIELHGGRIWAESQLEVGTTIYLELPLMPE